ncbi:M1 family metallopeptidase [Mucilaginibacter ginkgonis]|uniref:M1 family metallopeptidase n=1 Tax=Mucilaginibacter ginkgonis TaxID=2682091 RepID=A0A6I4IN21_9SPHI|nr:M1 family metallopeptidase [Mucilaginibacter ginkgonis]QQL51017.1 M1 family metallopeptidase [Mucilaginibacter ginkgonis]
MKFIYTCVCVALLFSGTVNAQQANRQDTVISSYNPAELFAPLFYKYRGSQNHSANGAPGPKYWQNRADYILNATIDTIANTLTGNATINYKNNSPDKLDFLWLQLDQNTYKADALSNSFTSYVAKERTRGYEISSVTVTVNGKTQKANYLVTDTRMQIKLASPLNADGGTISINIAYKYTIPGTFGNRTDWNQTKNGKIYEIAQWYPRMCVYDDAQGWDTLPFLGSGEFYLEYGDFDYKVTVPTGMIVAGAGELLNPQEVLNALQLARLANARKSDKTIMIRTADEVLTATKTSLKGTKTWHFKMLNTRDVAFGASSAYIWDAAKVNLPNNKPCLAMSVYPVESAGNDAWGRATEYLKESIEYFSKKWFVYPWPVAINEAGTAAGMEYPGIVFDGITDKGKELYWVTAHEIGHNWFPMIVGSNERRFGWMDEGFNTFIDVYASDNFNGGEYAPKRDDEYAPKGGYPADEIVPTILDPNAPTIMSIPDATPEKYRHPITYFKPALGLVMLREHILGPARFDYAFKHYIETWAYKHPQPEDFFRSMENAAGEDLSWFWRSWYYNNYKLDVAVIDARYADKDKKRGLNVTIANKEQMAMPVKVAVKFKDGGIMYKRLPVVTWIQNKIAVINLETIKEIASVELDPDHEVPDINRANNSIKVK